MALWYVLRRRKIQALNNAGMNEVAGGVIWEAIDVGVAAVGLGLAIVETGGLGGLAVGVIWGADTAGELLTAGAGLAAAGGGGVAMGYGMSH